MIFLNTEEIIYLHEKLIGTTGGSFGIRDRNLLESAIYGVFSAFDGVERYPSIEEKAARLAFSLVSNHAFVDGNKRIGVLAMLTTLSLNGVELDFTQNELVALGLGLADGNLDYDAVLFWINQHKAKF